MMHFVLRKILFCGLFVGFGWQGLAQAGSFSFLGTDADYKLTFNYALALRTKHPDQALINGPVDPLMTGPQAYEQRPGQPMQMVNFGRTGLSSTINLDDGDRNFEKYDLIHNRISAFGEFSLKHGEHFGAIFSGDAFYDDVYNRRNANTSPNTVNKPLPADRFSSEAKHFDGKRARVLDAYAYTDFNLTENTPVNIRAGEQVVAFGESLFLRGIALSSGRADATRSSVPGAEIKELLLPVNQVGLSVGLPLGINFLAYYQLEFKPTELFPAGDFLSPVDILGPGAKFAYGSINPAGGDSCQGLFGNAAAETILCGNPISGPLLNAPRTINVERRGDITPSQWTNYGFGFKVPVTDTTTVGLYRVRYTDSNPAIKLDFGCAYVGQLTAPVTGTVIKNITTCDINQFVPVTYHARYFGGINLTSLTFSTAYGIFNFAGELNYREHSDVQVKAIASKVLAPFFSTGNVGQVLISALSVGNPQFFFDEYVFVGEAGYVHVYSVDPIKEEPGLIPVGGGSELFTNRNSTGYQFLSYLNKRNILPGFDFKTTLTFGQILKGNPSLSGAFGPIYGEGDQRLGIGFSSQYLQNLEVGVSYQMFFGDAERVQRGTASESPAGGSNLPQNPFADRDFLAINVKYSL